MIESYLSSDESLHHWSFCLCFHVDVQRLRIVRIEAVMIIICIYNVCPSSCTSTMQFCNRHAVTIIFICCVFVARISFCFDVILTELVRISLLLNMLCSFKSFNIAFEVLLCINMLSLHYLGGLCFVCTCIMLYSLCQPQQYIDIFTQC